MVNDVRQEQTDLDKMPKGAGLFATAGRQAIPVLHGFSAYLVPRPSDWPDCAAVPG